MDGLRNRLIYRRQTDSQTDRYINIKIDEEINKCTDITHRLMDRWNDAQSDR